MAGTDSTLNEAAPSPSAKPAWKDSVDALVATGKTNTTISISQRYHEHRRSLRCAMKSNTYSLILHQSRAVS